MKRLVRVACLALCCLAGCTAAQSAPQRAPVQMTIFAKPLRGGGAEVAGVAIREEIRGTLDPARPFSLEIPIVYTGRTGIADRVDSLAERDALGAVSIVVVDDSANPNADAYYRHVRAQRRVVPPVIVTYRMRPNPVIRGGPQYEHFATGGGITSGGMQLFILPEHVTWATLHVHWDLSGLAPGSLAASTYGEGDILVLGPPDTLWNAFYLAGPAGTFISPTSGFRAYWLGMPTFAPRLEMAFAARAYEYLRRFYRDSTTTSYRVFIRAPGGGGGTAAQNSFMGGVAAGKGDTAVIGPRNTLTHEMGHYFLGELNPAEPFTDAWYSEGLNTYYTRLLLLRSGLAPVGDYLNDVNSNARRYYANPFRNASRDSLRKINFSTGFGPASAQNLDYTRGSLFWSDVDARIRIASGGRHTLDDVFLPLLDARRRGQPFRERDIAAALERELGPVGRRYFEDVIIRGESLALESGAFGPCFERRSVTVIVQGVKRDGYEWTRVPSMPDERCREW